MYRLLRRQPRDHRRGLDAQLASHLEGLFWPDADTGKLRTIGEAWTTAGTTVDASTWTIDSAIWQLKTQESPEIPDPVAACTELKQHTGDLADAYQQIGKACSDYAQHVDDHHRMIEDELASFIEWAVAIEVGGAIVGFFTLGLGEGAAQAAQAAEAAEVANTATRVVRILKALVELAKTVAETIGTLLTKVTQILADLKNFLNVRAIAALEKIAPVLLRNKLLDDLAAKGVKFTRDDVVAVWKDAEGDIPSFLREGLTNGTKIGTQGKGRPIYEVLWHGTLVRVAITVSVNGYVVGSDHQWLSRLACGSPRSTSASRVSTPAAGRSPSGWPTPRATVTTSPISAAWPTARPR